MFNFTTTLTYGLRLLINLSLKKEGPKQLERIAKEENISLGYLRKIVIPLEKAGILKSSRGPGGGFILNRKPSDISLSEVTSILNRSKVIDCIKGTSSCQRYGDCVVKDLLEEVYNKIQLVFRKKTLATILQRKKK